MKNNKIIKSVLISIALGAATSASAATYEVTEITPLDQYRQHFSLDLNDNGELVGVARDSFNFRFYNESYLREYRDAFLEAKCALDETELANGEFDAFSTYCLKLELAQNSTTTSLARNSGFQKIGDSRSFLSVNDSTTAVNLTDSIDEVLGGYTRSTIEQLSSINNNSIAVGSGTAPYLPSLFQQTGEDASDEALRIWQRAYKSRAVIYNNGSVTEIEPSFNLYGGVSAAVDISDAGFVTGYESISISETMQNEIAEKCNGELEPINVCVWRLGFSSKVFNTQAVIWQLDASGQVIDKIDFGLAFTPTEKQTRSYGSYASAINNNGIAVGYGDVPFSPTSSIVFKYPLIFDENGTREILADHNTYEQGYAVDINDNNIVVGKLQNASNNTFHDQFFVYDISTGKLETPITFYNSAESTANSINNAGLVVGEAEYEITKSQQRRRHGFIYNIHTEEFLDVNDLTECGSQYEIVEMRKINNNNEIAATALKSVERRDALGNVMLDDDGNPLQEEVAVSVLLTPTNGQIDDCRAIENPPYERRGFSFTASLAILLSSLIAIRRKFI